MTQEAVNEEKTDLYDFELGRFQELRESDEDYALQRYGLTLVYSIQPEETFELLEKMGWKGEDPIDLYNRGTVQALNGEYDEALKLYQEAEKAGCDQPELFYNLGFIYEEKSDAAKAKEYFQKYIDAIEQYPSIPRSLQEDLDEVREHLKEMES